MATGKDVGHKDIPGENDQNGDRKQVRVWMDGSFDLLHAGHVSAMLQARSLGHILVVGAQPDADVLAHKGPPVYPEHERFRLIQAVKFVDEFMGAASYGTSIETLDMHRCDFCVHGDDATLRASDTDVIKLLMAKNRAKLVSRGIGASTTTQIQRVLQRSEAVALDKVSNGSNNKQYLSGPTNEMMIYPSASQICAFLDGRGSQPGNKVVYVDGAFDLFNIGHLSFLEKAAQYGDFLLVGVHTDSIVTKRKGPVFPVLSMMERALLVLSLKCVSDVVFDAPSTINQEFLDLYKIKVVVRGTTSGDRRSQGVDPYLVPKTLGMYKEVDSGCDVTSNTIVERILNNREAYLTRNKRKIEKEAIAAEKLKSTKMPTPHQQD